MLVVTGVQPMLPRARRECGGGGELRGKGAVRSRLCQRRVLEYTLGTRAMKGEAADGKTVEECQCALRALRSRDSVYQAAVDKASHQRGAARRQEFHERVRKALSEGETGALRGGVPPPQPPPRGRHC